MKNKILASITALCAALVLVGGFSVTAYAQTPTEETDDSGVIVETEPQPLTPEGNMTLVDDIDWKNASTLPFPLKRTILRRQKHVFPVSKPTYSIILRCLA